MLSLLITLIVLGLIFYLVDRYIPMDAPFKTGVRIVAVIIVILLIVKAFLPFLHI